MEQLEMARSSGLGGIKPISPPEPSLTPEVMINRAEAMRGLLRERQAQMEVDGNISAETNQAFIDAGFYRVVQPRLFGGYEFDEPTYMRLVMAIARGCPESAWVLSLTAGHVYQMASFPLEGQVQVYGADGEFRAPEVTAPPGSATPAPGGYRVSGTWDYASGCAVATHILVVVKVEGADGGAIMAAVDRSDYEIVRNWSVIGMQGTGSDRIVIKDAFVPQARTKPVFDAKGVRQIIPSDPRVGKSPLFFAPYRAFVVSESAAVVVGAAQGALDCYEETFIARKSGFVGGVSRHELAEYQLNFGRCRALVDTARAALLQTASDQMAFGLKVQTDGLQISEEDDRRLALVLMQCVHLAHEAVDIMFRTAGSSTAKRDSMLGRYWRNISVLRGHLAHQSDTSSINYGRVHFGHDPVGVG